MKRLQIDPIPYYLVAFLMSMVLAMFVTGFASARLPIPDKGGAILGVLAFCFILFFDLFIMYHIWSERYEGEDRVAARWLAVLAIGGLLVASGVGLFLWFADRIIPPIPLWATTLFGCALIVSGATGIAGRWLNRKTPVLNAQPTDTAPWEPIKGWIALGDWFALVWGAQILIFRIWPQSRMTAGLGSAMAISLVAAFVLWTRRRQHPH